VAWYRQHKDLTGFKKNNNVERNFFTIWVAWFALIWVKVDLLYELYAMYYRCSLTPAKYPEMIKKLRATKKSKKKKELENIHNKSRYDDGQSTQFKNIPGKTVSLTLRLHDW
jgi:hypothetical protein